MLCSRPPSKEVSQSGTRHPLDSDALNSLLGQVGAGERASTELMGLLYTELRAIAERMMKSERRSHTLQPTALVHEAFLRLVDAEGATTRGHLYFLDAAAVTMRRVLVDHARAAKTDRRGGAELRKQVTLHGIIAEESGEDVDLAVLDAALLELEQLSPRRAKIVELRFFAGMTGQQIADHMEISASSVTRDLAFSRAWLQRRMRGESGD